MVTLLNLLDVRSYGPVELRPFFFIGRWRRSFEQISRAAPAREAALIERFGLGIAALMLIERGELNKRKAH